MSKPKSRFLPTERTSLRLRIMASVGALVLLSLLGSVYSLYRITAVNRLLDAINRVSVPLSRLLTQMQSDAEVFYREAERNLGQPHWQDPHWRPRPAPRWIKDVLESETQRALELIQGSTQWADPQTRQHWQTWMLQVSENFRQLTEQLTSLHTALEQGNDQGSSETYAKWISGAEEWKRQLQWGAAEYERFLRRSFSLAENQVAELRTGLEVVLVVVVLMSLLLLWLGERALRPLSELTLLARDIARRGLRREDKSLMPQLSLSRSDEVSQLAREFHHMATSLLEREIMVEDQKTRLQEQNRLLRDMGALNQNILNSIESVLIVTNLENQVTQFNPEAIRWLGVSENELKGSFLSDWPKLELILKSLQPSQPVLPILIDGKYYGGRMMSLRQEDGTPHGGVLVVDDLTQELDLQERLRRAENMAAVGRMSAQVAHEVRNPLHSIGLEAEMAIEMASQEGNIHLKQSLQSILNSVDRLQKITENYLKLSKLSKGEKRIIDLGLILEAVLATYTPVCEAQNIKVQWEREPGANLNVLADADLLEQVLGNLFKNSLQALESYSPTRIDFQPQVHWKLGNTEAGMVWLRIQDNGPGLSSEIKKNLFTPFLTTRAQGTGLGLSFVKEVVEDHHGVIHLIEGTEIAGACFELKFPMASFESMAQIEKDSYAQDFIS